MALYTATCTLIIRLGVLKSLLTAVWRFSNT